MSSNQRDSEAALSGAGCLLLSCAALLVALALVGLGILVEATTHV